MAKVTIDVTSIPAGLTKREFIKRPEMKKIKSWFTAAGIVELVTGLFGFAQVGQLAEALAQGYQVSDGYMMILSALAVIAIVLGIIMLIRKSTITAYIIGATEILKAIFFLTSGGRIGAGMVAVVAAFIGAVRVDKAWKQYTSGQ